MKSCQAPGPNRSEELEKHKDDGHSAVGAIELAGEKQETQPRANIPEGELVMGKMEGIGAQCVG